MNGGKRFDAMHRTLQLQLALDLRALLPSPITEAESKAARERKQEMGFA